MTKIFIYVAKTILDVKPDMAKQLISFRFEPELIKDLEKLAKAENRTVSNYVETQLKKVVEDLKKKKK